IQRARRGVYTITDKGRALLAEAPKAITRAFLIERYPEYRAYIEASRQRSSTSAEGTAEALVDLNAEAAAITPDELIDTAAKTLTAALEADLLERVRTVHP